MRGNRGDALNSEEGRQEGQSEVAAGTAFGRPVPDILSLIKDSYGELRPAERRVADTVLADVSFCVGASHAQLARRAVDSEPTDPRFCRGIGRAGRREFKL